MIHPRMQAGWLVAALLAGAAVGAAQEGSPPAVDEAKARALAHLEQSMEKFLSAIDGLSDEQWRWKPAPDRWSVGECAEHIARAEPFLRSLIQGATVEASAAELLAGSHGKEETVLRFITDRSQKFQAPETANPAQSGATRPRQALERDFLFERGRTYEFVSALDDLRGHARRHPAFEELDLSGWVLFLSGHTERHTLQLEEVKASAGFPAG